MNYNILVEEGLEPKFEHNETLEELEKTKRILDLVIEKRRKRRRS
jgi:ketol-acid reductoisomerase